MLVLDGSGDLGEGVWRYVNGVLNNGQLFGRSFRTWQCLSGEETDWMNNGDW